MMINDLLNEKNMSMYQLAKNAGVAYSTVNKICNEELKLEKCHAETVYKIAGALGVSMDDLVQDAIFKTYREESYEHSLPPYLQHDLDAFKEGLKNHSSLLDCLWGELYGSINSALIDDRLITEEHADYLRKKYLFG